MALRMTPIKTLQINIKTIPETPALTVDLDLGQEWFARWQKEDPGLEFADARISRPGALISKHGHDILVRGHLEGQLATRLQPLSGALQPPVAIDFDLLLVPGPGPGGRNR